VRLTYEVIDERTDSLRLLPASFWQALDPELIQLSGLRRPRSVSTSFVSTGGQADAPFACASASSWAATLVANTVTGFEKPSGSATTSRRARPTTA
jgi:hypothetical protein